MDADRWRQLEQKIRAAAAREPRFTVGPITTNAQLEQTLLTMVHRTAAVLVADGCVFLLHDRHADELAARPPALGVSEEALGRLRVPVSGSLVGEVLRLQRPVIVNHPHLDPRAASELAALPDLRNLLCVPLRVEEEDEQQGIIHCWTIGVLCVFNKRDDASFTEEDNRLLGILSKTVAAILQNAIRYRALASERRGRGETA